MPLLLPLPRSTEALAALLAVTPWPVAALLVLSNIAVFPLFFYNIRIKTYFAAAVAALSFFMSWMYHQCMAWPTACLHVPLDVWRRNDYIWASAMVAIVLIHVMRFYVHRWVSLISVGSVGIIVFLVTASDFGIRVHLFVIFSALLLLFIKASLFDAVDCTGTHNFDDLRRFDVKQLGTGIFLGLIGISLFFFDGGEHYIIAHPLWHVTIYLAAYFVMLGSTRDLPGWYPTYDIYAWCLSPCNRYHYHRQQRYAASELSTNRTHDIQQPLLHDLHEMRIETHCDDQGDSLDATLMRRGMVGSPATPSHSSFAHPIAHGDQRGWTATLAPPTTRRQFAGAVRTGASTPFHIPGQRAGSHGSPTRHPSQTTSSYVVGRPRGSGS